MDADLIFVLVVVGLVGCALIFLAGYALWRTMRRRSRGTKAVDQLIAEMGGIKQGDWVNVHRPWGMFSFRFQKGDQHTSPTLHVAVPIVTPGKFLVRRQTGFDRLATAIGLAQKIRTGDDEFDRQFYIESATPAFAAAILAEPSRRQDIVDILGLGFTNVCCDGKQFLARWVKRKAKKEGDAELLEQAGLQLARLCRDLPYEVEEIAAGNTATRSSWLGLAILWSVVVVLVATAAIIFVICFNSGWPLDWWPLAQLSLSSSIPGWVLFAGLALAILRRRSTGHKELLAVVIVALFVFALAGYLIAVYVNSAFDTGPPSQHTQVIVSKHSSTHRGHTTYRVEIARWDIPGQSTSFTVSSTDYQTVQIGTSCVNVTTRPGWLGHTWIESYSVIVIPRLKRPVR
jgi:hypothetical protein